MARFLLLFTCLALRASAFTLRPTAKHALRAVLRVQAPGEGSAPDATPVPETAAEPTGSKRFDLNAARDASGPGFNQFDPVQVVLCHIHDLERLPNRYVR